MVQTTVADMITPRERGHYQAYMGTAWIVAGVVGPALGGIIADQLHWSADLLAQRAARAGGGAV